MKMDVLIVDDCESAIANAKCALLTANVLPELRDVSFEVETFINPEEAIKSKKKFHFALIDVDMPEMNGFQLAEQFIQKQPNCMIIFLTNHLERAPEGYFVRAHRYLEKPIMKEKFDEAVVSAVTEFRSFGTLTVKDKSGTRELELREILYIETFGNDSNVHDIKGNQFECRMSLSKIRTQVPNWLFFHCNRNYLVNMEHYDSWDRGEKLIFLKSENTIRTVEISVRNLSKVERSVQLYRVEKGSR